MNKQVREQRNSRGGMIIYLLLKFNYIFFFCFANFFSFIGKGKKQKASNERDSRDGKYILFFKRVDILTNL